MSEKEKNLPIKRPHLYEIDFIRAWTVFSVVTLHTISYTKFLVTGPAALQALLIIGHDLNYNRQMFMFVTAFVLTYVYLHKKWSIKQFYSKRFLVVFIPYVLWSILYILFNNNSLSLPDFINKSIDGIITGGASFQLYYILLTLQFYAFFPLFLYLIKKYIKLHIPILIVSLLIQLAVSYYDFHYIQTSSFTAPPFLETLIQYRDRIFLTYFFFFVLGGIAAWHIERSRHLLKKYGKLIPLMLIAAVAAYSSYFYLQKNVFDISQYKAAGVLQPSVHIYSIFVIIFLTWLATVWEKRRIFYRLIHNIAQSSFGIYFVHVMALSLSRQYILPLIPELLPIPFKIVIILITAFSGSLLFCMLLLKIPLLSWTIGRPAKIVKK